MFRANWDRVITPTLLNRVTLRPQRLVSGRGRPLQQRQRVRHERYRTEERARTGQALSTPRLLARLPGLGTVGGFGGSGNYLWAFTDDLTWVKGGHSYKFGFIFQQDHYDGYGWHTAAGTYNFNRGATAGFLPNGTLDTTGASGNAFASFLLGEVQSSEITTNRYVSDQWQYYSAYAQDDWRVNDKLTLNYGLRYRYTPPTFEGYYPRRLLELQPDAAESGRRRPARGVGVRRRTFSGPRLASGRCPTRGLGGWTPGSVRSIP